MFYIIVLRYIHEDNDTTKYGDEENNKKLLDQGSLVQTKDSGGFRLDDQLDLHEKQKSPNRNKDPGGSLWTTTWISFGPAKTINHNSLFPIALRLHEYLMEHS
jgi:hypothetical protein